MSRGYIIYGDVFLKHQPRYHHPENPERLRATLNGLRNYGIMELFEVIEPRAGGIELALKIHDKDYVMLVQRLSKGGYGWMDGDTYVSPGTLEAALHGLGAAAQSVELALISNKPVFVLVRPPGHHAGRSLSALGAPSNGFCIFNNVALAAETLLERGYERIAILDFDLHYGNGTQEIFYGEPRVLHIDIHQDPLTIYPGTGFPEQTGEGEAQGTKINILIPPGSGDDIYGRALEIALKIIDSFQPQAILVSAGFDAYRGDGLAATMKAGSQFYHKAALEVSERCRQKPLVTFLEGGYTLGLSRGLPAYAAGLVNSEDPVKDPPSESGKHQWNEFKDNVERLKKAVKWIEEVVDLE